MSAAEETGVCIAGHVALKDSTGLANVNINLSLVAYIGERIATTDENGDIQSDSKFIPGDENGQAALNKEVRFYPVNAEPFVSYLDIGIDTRTLEILKAKIVPNAQKVDIFRRNARCALFVFMGTLLFAWIIMNRFFLPDFG